jgi:hypothetical protein
VNEAFLPAREETESTVSLEQRTAFHLEKVLSGLAESFMIEKGADEPAALSPSSEEHNHCPLQL